MGINGALSPLTFAAVALIHGPAAARTFYVDDVGNDANDGLTARRAWATLQHAVDTMGHGDTTIVLPGVYAGCRIERSGEAGRPKTLRAVPPWGAVVATAGPNNQHGSNIEVEMFDGVVQHWVIDGFDIPGAVRSGVDLRGTRDITVQNCHVHDSGRTGIFTAFSDFVVIQGNESESNGEHGVYTSNSGDFPVVRGNLLHHNQSAGVHMNGDRNFTPGDGLISFAAVEANVIWENGVAGASAINCDGVSDSVIRNNLLFSNHASGISLYAIDGSEGSSRNKVYNNTIVMAEGSRWVINIPASPDGIANPRCNRIVNNILYTPRLDRGSILIYPGGAEDPCFHSDHNVVVNRFSRDGGETIISLAAWQRATGQDRHSFVVAPEALFVDPASDDYRLRLGSPAMNRGAFLGLAVPDDLDGTPRPVGGAVDIGAHEVDTSGAPD
ncbi:right-handed parallel beta-helix repeat-containing protein [Sorangium cellulosum]|uniref:right-handed parallel beta-helix repeat-containing protein n=1 Tax=Sorangium cellulosum TaxID=56 RepID=UPI0009D6F260|nr:right-handed parallel beta-helix repeat-containing protein [Sorangium cellulosum]